jgi:hypothetical protein
MTERGKIYTACTIACVNATLRNAKNQNKFHPKKIFRGRNQRKVSIEEEKMQKWKTVMPRCRHYFLPDKFYQVGLRYPNRATQKVGS